MLLFPVPVDVAEGDTPQTHDSLKSIKEVVEVSTNYLTKLQNKHC